MAESLQAFARELAACRHCAPHLPHAPRPIFQLPENARIGVFSQAPGNLAHQGGKPFMDPSGVRLRQWMGVDEAEFYDSGRIAIAPMAFCFPGYDKNGGDLPPRKECAPLWRERAMAALPRLDLVLLVGSYAQNWHLRRDKKRTLTETVAAWRDYGPKYVPLPHPSWRNNGWIKKNPWFEAELAPHVQARVRALLGGPAT
ncbi:MAG: uracil-DNA glycosylase family protein [Pseudomonadota bacterium]